MEISTWDPFVLKRSIRSFVSTPIHHTDMLDRISFVPTRLVTSYQHAWSHRRDHSHRYARLHQPYAPPHRSIVSTAHSSVSMPGLILIDTLYVCIDALGHLLRIDGHSFLHARSHRLSDTLTQSSVPIRSIASTLFSVELNERRCKLNPISFASTRLIASYQHANLHRRSF